MSNIIKEIVEEVNLSFESASIIPNRTEMDNFSKVLYYKLTSNFYEIFDMLEVRTFANGTLHLNFSKTGDELQVPSKLLSSFSIFEEDSNGCKIEDNIDKKEFKDYNYYWCLDINLNVLDDEYSEEVFYLIMINLGCLKPFFKILDFHKYPPNYIREEVGFY